MRCKFILLCLLCLTLVASGQCQNGPQIIELAKKATVFVQDEQGSAGSAFCIDPAGLFVTNAHVVEDARAGSMKLVLYPGEKEQIVTRAKIIRIDKQKDLALLKIEPDALVGRLTALPLGSADGLFETMPVAAFGFPFGQDLAITENDFPAVTVSTGRITALRKLRGALQQVQFDASINPGNSGGPLINEKGQVVGIVVAEIFGAEGLKFAIPVTDLVGLLVQPVIGFNPPTIAAGMQNRAHDFNIAVTPFAKGAANYTVEMTLSSTPNDQRTFTASPRANNTYVVRAEPLPQSIGPKELKVTAQSVNGSVIGRVKDRDLKLGARTIRLNQVQRIDRDSNAVGKHSITLKNGEILTGSVSGLEAVEANIIDAWSTMDFTRFTSIRVQDMEAPIAAVTYKITVKQGNKVVGEQGGSIKIEEAPAVPIETPRVVPPILPSPGSQNKPTAPGAPVLPPDPALVWPPPLTPAPLTLDKITVGLPAPVEDMVAGAGGRYLILWLKKVMKLAVFDVSQAKVIKYLSVNSDDVKFAAGAEKLIVVLNDQNVMQRYDLRTLERELSVTAPEGGTVINMAMGYASYGPLLIYNGQTIFMEPATFKKLEVDTAFTRFYAWGGDVHDAMQLRASADGSVFTAWRSGTSYGVIMALEVNGKAAKINATTGRQSYLQPDYDGSTILTQDGPLNIELKPIAAERFRDIASFAAYGTGYFAGAKALPHPGKGMSFYVYSSTDKKLLVSALTLEEMAVEQWVRSGLTLEKRLHFIPAANLLITIPQAKDQLVIRRFNLLEAMDNSGVDYLFVNSMPGRTARRGQLYSYQLDVKSKRGGVQYVLESGPPGMTLSKTGKLEWPVQADYQGKEENVIITVRDASGQEIYHSFKIPIQ